MERQAGVCMRVQRSTVMNVDNHGRKRRSRKRLATDETGADAIVQNHRRMQVFKVTKRMHTVP